MLLRWQTDKKSIQNRLSKKLVGAEEYLREEFENRKGKATSERELLHYQTKGTNPLSWAGRIEERIETQMESSKS